MRGTATVTIKLPEQLKRRISRLAQGRGITAHAFMLDAIREQARRATLREEFHQQADEAERDLERSGHAYDAKDVHAYVRARIQGKPATRPKLKPWR